MEETLRIADKLIETTCKSKDHVQQSNDFFFVAEVKVFVVAYLRRKHPSSNNISI